MIMNYKNIEGMKNYVIEVNYVFLGKYSIYTWCKTKKKYLSITLS